LNLKDNDQIDREGHFRIEVLWEGKHLYVDNPAKLLQFSNNVN
jgi:hypothetical protein